jgi:riboflavin kinase/FMN adenylyltransferase
MRQLFSNFYTHLHWRFVPQKRNACGPSQFLRYLCRVLTIQHTEHFRIEKPAIVTIGTFDGVHLGHQKILKRLKQLKESTGLQTIVLTFEPHPRKILFPEQKDLKLLTSIDEKLALFQKHELDVAVVYPFSKTFANSSAQHYVEELLVKHLKVAHLVIGYDHKFAKNREGDIHVLKQYAHRLNFSIDEISALDIDNIAVSSSKIRKALDDGKVSLAKDYLGHHYFLSARVVAGKQLGRQLGYPTANLQVMNADKMIPKGGVYFVRAEHGNYSYFGMMNIGTNPTTDTGEQVKLEVHLFDFDADIYGEQLHIHFVEFLRDEKKFANLEELKQALAEDKKQCLLKMAQNA